MRIYLFLGLLFGLLFGVVVLGVVILFIFGFVRALVLFLQRHHGAPLGVIDAFPGTTHVEFRRRLSLGLRLGEGRLDVDKTSLLTQVRDTELTIS